jgi:hypothetical protein
MRFFVIELDKDKISLSSIMAGKVKNGVQETASFFPGERLRLYEVDPDDLFNELKHGDEKHQQWLKEAIWKYFAPYGIKK